jgi:hypothetical protein
MVVGGVAVMNKLQPLLGLDWLLECGRELYLRTEHIDAIFELARIHWHSLCDLVGTTCGAREYLRRIGWLHALPSAVDSQTLFGVKCLREGLVDDALAG